MRFIKIIPLVLFIVFLNSFLGCSIYKSADRNQFENESAELKIRSFEKMTCSNKSYENELDQSKTQILEKKVIAEINSESIWAINYYDQFLNEEILFYESESSDGKYCQLAIEFE